VGRLGGEEFVVLLPVTSLDGARIVAEHIRAAVARYSIHIDKEVVSGLTVSVGVCMGRTTEPLEALLERADRAMYSAKQQGRDRIHVSIE
jgi:diguanylate cyclase (GGDEF)-like protein